MTIEMEDAKTIALIDGWIADYYSHLIWKQFEKDGCLSSHRDSSFLQKSKGHHIITHELSKEEGTFCPELNPYLLIDFMYKVSFGEKLFEDVQKSGHTLLEEAIEILDQILSFGQGILRKRDSVMRLKLQLRQQAVLVCCKKNEFELAKEVFVREWRHWRNENEMEIRQKLSEIIEQQNNNHRYIDAMPYSSLTDECRMLLRKIFSTLKTPFLVTTAQNIFSHFDSFVQTYTSSDYQNVSNDTKQASDSDNTEALSPSLTDKGKPDKEKHTKSVETETAVAFRTNVRPGSEVTDSAENRKCESLQKNYPETVTGCSKDIDRSRTKCKAEHSDSSKTELKGNTSELESPGEPSKRKRRSEETKSDWEAELNSTVLPTRESKRRKIWRPKEEEQLFLGVQKFGVGQWRKVAKFLGSNRSNVDVKDKWRTMTKQGKLEAYEKRFGPL